MTAASPTMSSHSADAPPVAATPAAEDPSERRRAAPWVVSTYFAEGLPYTLVHLVVAQEYLTAIDVNARTIGLTSLLHLPWHFKFVWSPLLDRYGTMKKWQIGAQLCIAVSLLFAAYFASRNAVSPVLVVLLAMSVMAATNDVAIDAFYMRVLSKGAQVSLTGPRIAAYRAAMLAGRGGLVMLAGVFGWGAALVAGAGVMAASALGHAALLPQDKKDEQAARVGWDIIRTFFSKPGVAWSIGLLLTFRAGDALMFAMNAKFLKDLGLGTVERGLYNGTLGTLASMAGAMLGAAMVARRGLERALVPIALLQGFAILLYVALAAARPPLGVIAAVVIVEQLVAGIGLAAFLVFIVRLCEGTHQTKHFAFASAIMSLAVTGAGTASGFLLESVGFTVFFTLAFAAAIPGMVLAWVVSRGLARAP